MMLCHEGGGDLQVDGIFLLIVSANELTCRRYRKSSTRLNGYCCATQTFGGFLGQVMRKRIPGSTNERTFLVNNFTVIKS